MLIEPTKGVVSLFLSPVIGFGCICAKKGFRIKGAQSCFHDEMERFQVPERINDNAYKFDLPFQSNVSVTSNVYDVSPSNVGDDLRANPLQEEGNDEAKDPVIVHVGPVTRTRAKRL